MLVVKRLECNKKTEGSTLAAFAFLTFYLSTVFYVRRTGQHQWRCSDVTFHSASRGLCEQWIEVINEQLSLLSMYCFNDALYQL